MTGYLFLVIFSFSKWFFFSSFMFNGGRCWQSVGFYSTVGIALRYVTNEDTRIEIEQHNGTLVRRRQAGGLRRGLYYALPGLPNICYTKMHGYCWLQKQPIAARNIDATTESRKEEEATAVPPQSRRYRRSSSSSFPFPPLVLNLYF